jgi:NAD(P)-dependent dehydrogenase (short-subunit alcohol dehydrogenase family)
MSTKFNLSSQTIVLTGGMGLFGQELCASILGAGATLIVGDIVDIDSDFIKKLHNAYAEKFLYLHLDVSDENSVKSFYLNTVKKYKNINVLINAASINPKVTKDGNGFSGSIDQIDKKSFMYEIEVGLYGAFSCSKYFGNHMAKNGNGSIVNIASDLSVISPDHRLYSNSDENKVFKPITYSIIKHGLVGMTKYFATYWPPEKNMRCNSLSPGGIYDNQDEEFVRKISSLIPLGRMARKDEYSDLVLFLCSDGSSYINGHNLVADGGRSIW